jgi:hypothetical protein
MAMEVFDLTDAQLKQAVETAVGEPIGECRVTRLDGKRGASGICGEYRVVSLLYRASRGAEAEITLFVRRGLGQGEGFYQEHHYRALAELGVPVPRLCHAHIDEGGREVLVLEHVREITEEHEAWLSDAANCRALLSLMARFASIQPPADYLALVGKDMARREGYTRSWNTWLPWSIHIIGRVWRHALNRELRPDLERWCEEHPDARGELQEAARRLVNTTRRLEMGLIHGDLHPGNVGWTSGPGSHLVLFDFGDVMIDFRFYDVAMYLGSLDEPAPMRCGPREGLAAYYLDELGAHGGESPGPDRFVEDVRLIWFTRKLNLWELLPRELGGPEYLGPEGEDTRANRLDRLFRLLEVLHKHAPWVASLGA